jgi:hypothetical protein
MEDESQRARELERLRAHDGCADERSRGPTRDPKIAATDEEAGRPRGGETGSWTARISLPDSR